MSQENVYMWLFVNCQTHHHQWFWSAVVLLVSFSAFLLFCLFLATQCSINRWLFSCFVAVVFAGSWTRNQQDAVKVTWVKDTTWMNEEVASLETSWVHSNVMGVWYWLLYLDCSMRKMMISCVFSGLTHSSHWLPVTDRSEVSSVKTHSQPDQTQASFGEQHETKLRASTATSLSQKEIWQNLEKTLQDWFSRSIQRPLPAWI